MNKLILLITILILSTACKEGTKDQPETTKPMTEAAILAKAKEIHKNVMTLDTHCDINVKNFTDSINYTQKLTSQVNLPKMQEGGLDVPWFIV